MKRNLIDTILSLVLLSGIITSCTKIPAGAGPVSSSFNIVNVIPGATPLVVNFNTNNTLQYYRTALQIPAATSATPYYTFGGYIGDYPLGISLYTDTLHTLVKASVHLDAGTSHTLILTGTLTAPDTLFKADDLIPVTDSVVRIRFINASPGIVPININIAGNQANPLVTNLAYKGASKFITVPAKKANLTSITASGVTTYNCVFEFRNASTSALITTYTLTPVIPVAGVTAAKLFKNVSIVLKGASTAPSAVVINHF